MKRIILTPHNQQEVIQEAAAVLQQGGLVIYPTETCYGIGADATNQEAIDRLLRYKTKRADKPLSVAVASADMAAQYVEINPTARRIYDHFLPGPITVVSKGKHALAAGVESSMGTQGIRIPDHPFVLELLAYYQKPITATSANASYKKTPYTIEDVLDNISGKQAALVDLAIDAGRLPKRKPSTVVETTLDSLHIVRDGGLQLEQSQVFESRSLEETEQFVEQIYTSIEEQIGKKTVVILLQGDLGAGKTHFTKILAKKLDVKDVVSSPTFLICCEYTGAANGTPILLQHMDTYRLYEPNEIDALRPERIFKSPNVVVIEWANKVADYIQPYVRDAAVVKIRITTIDEHSRKFEYDTL